MFTIGTSSTTGEQDTVVWNEIHHKTEAFSNHMGHGYPDPNYLDNVLSELAAQGVEDDVEITVVWLKMGQNCPKKKEKALKDPWWHWLTL